ncbi:MAG: hypothetical protein K2Q12_04200 [Rickettsiales bacterium]|nr:hypothetical protein [Rickettsiales bacterium]
MFRNFGLWTFITVFGIIALANLPMVQDMPLAVQLSYFANEALWYIRQFTDPVMDYVRQLSR